MFGPKNTLASVAEELVHGFERGTVVLHPTELTEADIKNFESMLKAKLARYRRIQIGLWVFTVLMIITTFLLWAILPPKPMGHSYPVELSILSFFAGGVAGNLFAYWAHRRSVELDIFIQILKMADVTTARRLVIWEGARLREKALVP